MKIKVNRIIDSCKYKRLTKKSNMGIPGVFKKKKKDGKIYLCKTGKYKIIHTVN